MSDESQYPDVRTEKVQYRNGTSIVKSVSVEVVDDRGTTHEGTITFGSVDERLDDSPDEFNVRHKNPYSRVSERTLQLCEDVHEVIKDVAAKWQTNNRKKIDL